MSEKGWKFFDLTTQAKKEKWSIEELILRQESLYAKYRDANIIIPSAKPLLERLIGPCVIIVNDYLRDAKLIKIDPTYGLFISKPELRPYTWNIIPSLYTPNIKDIYHSRFYTVQIYLHDTAINFTIMVLHKGITLVVITSNNSVAMLEDRVLIYPIAEFISKVSKPINKIADLHWHITRKLAVHEINARYHAENINYPEIARLTKDQQEQMYEMAIEFNERIRDIKTEFDTQIQPGEYHGGQYRSICGRYGIRFDRYSIAEITGLPDIEDRITEAKYVDFDDI